jgi:hypothetical protein
MVRLRMWDTGTGCGRASWIITRARQSRSHLSTAMVMVASKATVVVATNLLLPRNSGPSEEMDAITVHHNSILGVLRSGHTDFKKYHTVSGVAETGYSSIVASIENKLRYYALSAMGSATRF